MSETNAEIVARAVKSVPHEELANRGYVAAITDAVLAALREAGRLVPEGHVCIERGRWERVLDAAEWASAHTKTLIQSGDLDP